MAYKIGVEGLQVTMSKFLSECSDEILEKVNESTKELAKEGAKSLKTYAKESSSSITGKKLNSKNYVNSFTSKLLKSSRMGDTYVIYCKEPYSGIAHLLEWGHKVVSHGKDTGKRAGEYHHWTKVQEEIANKISEIVAKGIENL